MASNVREGRKEEQIRQICERARRTVGFNKIGEEDIRRMYGEAVPWGGATTRENALHLAVQEFMDCEMKVKSNERESMEIEEIFEKKSGELDTVYG